MILCSWSCPSLVCVEERRGEERLRCHEMVPGGPQTRLETAGLQSVPRPPQLRVRPCDQTGRQTDRQTSDLRYVRACSTPLIHYLIYRYRVILRNKSNIEHRVQGITFLMFNVLEVKHSADCYLLNNHSFIFSLQNGLFDNYQTTISQLQ